MTLLLAGSAMSRTGSPTFVTYRRELIDRGLSSVLHDARGQVLDLGGKRSSRRGNFSPPEDFQGSWIFLNIAKDNDPHLVADAHHIPLAAAAFDEVVCTEVIEHLSDPSQAIAEIHRVLRPGGRLVLTVPFLYPVHGDPSDFQRFTNFGLENLLSQFAEVKISPMGSFWGTIGMLLDIGKYHVGGHRVRRSVIIRLIRLMARLSYHVDRINPSDDSLPSFTTGYIAVAWK